MLSQLSIWFMPAFYISLILFLTKKIPFDADIFVYNKIISWNLDLRVHLSDAESFILVVTN